MVHAIIGCGRIAKEHVVACQKLGITLNWCCDVNKTNVDEFGKQHNIGNCTTCLETIAKNKDITSVSIATPHNTHASIARYFLRHNKHVLIEKPVSLTCFDIQSLITLAKKRKLVVLPLFQHRFDPIVEKVKEFIDKGYFGDVTYIGADVKTHKKIEYYSQTWRGSFMTEGGSALINQGIHSLDIIQFLKDKPACLSAFGSQQKFHTHIETEDSLVANFMFEDNSLGSLLVTSTSHETFQAVVRVIGTKGSVSFHIDNSNELAHCSFESSSKKLESQLKKVASKTTNKTKSYYGLSHQRVFEHFFALQKSRKICDYSELELAKNTLKTVLHIYWKIHKFNSKFLISRLYHQLSSRLKYYLPFVDEHFLLKTVSSK